MKKINIAEQTSPAVQSRLKRAHARISKILDNLNQVANLDIFQFQFSRQGARQVTPVAPTRGRGRPAGSKNKPKTGIPTGMEVKERKVAVMPPHKKNEFTLQEIVAKSLRRRAKTPQEILNDVVKNGYKFASANPIGSVQAFLYGTRGKAIAERNATTGKFELLRAGK